MSVNLINSWQLTDRKAKTMIKLQEDFIEESSFDNRRDQILDLVQQRDIQKVDRVFLMDELSFEQDIAEPEDDSGYLSEFAALELPDDDIGPSRKVSLSMNGWARSQLLNRIGIPVTYFDKCPIFLKKENLDYWITQNSEKKIMLRMLGNTIRAVFSSRFSPTMDDDILYKLVLGEAEKHFGKENLLIRSFVADPEFSVLQIIFKNISVEYKNMVVYGGVTIMNSEVGRSSVWIKPMIISTNLLSGYSSTFSSVTSDLNMCFRHVGDLSPEKIKNALNEAFTKSQIGIHRLLETSEEMVEDPEKELEEIVNRSNMLAHRMFLCIQDDLKKEEKMSKFALTELILKAVEHLPLFKRQKTQEEVGRYLDLFRNKNRLQNLDLE